MKWKNILSYGRNETDREPRTFECRIGPLLLVVRRHIHYPADAWIGECEPLVPTIRLASKDIEEAKCQLVAMVQVVLLDTLKEIQESE